MEEGPTGNTKILCEEHAPTSVKDIPWEAVTQGDGIKFLFEFDGLMGEHMWIKVIEIQGRKVHGLINNHAVQPQMRALYPPGRHITREKSEAQDWQREGEKR